jgi:hypothetical protein
MAKKVVATLKDKTAGPGMTKVIRAVKNPKTGAYSFKEEIVRTDLVQDVLNKKD